MRKSTRLSFALTAFVATAVFAQDPWPGGREATKVDLTWLDADMQDEMSGAVWNPELEKLWIVTDDNNLWRLSCPGHCDLAAAWRIDTDGADEAKWSLSGDTEAVTLADWAEETVFIGVEQSGFPSPRPRIREYDVSGPLGTISQTNEWRLNEMGSASSGLEALTFVPDEWLAAAAFVDALDNPYTGSAFGTGGLFFAGLQDNGHIFVFDLDRTTAGNYVFVGEYRTVGAGGAAESEIAGLEFDRSNGVLYSYHNYESIGGDDVLNQLALAPVNVPAAPAFESQQGWFGPRVENNEGIALVPAGECDEFGFRRFFLMTDNGGPSNSVGIYPLFPCDPRPTPPAVAGCVTLQGAPVVGEPVRLEQPGAPTQQTMTDADGCYAFETAVSGNRFLVGVRGPIVP